MEEKVAVLNGFSITKRNEYVVIAPEGDFNNTHSVTVTYHRSGEVTINHWSGNGSPAEVAAYATVMNFAVEYVSHNPTILDWSWFGSVIVAA